MRSTGTSAKLAGSGEGTRELWALAAIAAPFAAGWVLVPAWQNVPVIDDWVYAWSVEHFIKTGKLQIADISAVYPIAQVAWGILFARVFGFSFGALRLSTIVLAIAGCWALYLTLRELGISRRVSILVALTVAWHPVYFALAFTFMTDVPFVAVASLAIYLYISGLVRDQTVRLWWGSALAVAAFLIRPVAVVLPFAVACGLIWRARQPPTPNAPNQADGPVGRLFEAAWPLGAAFMAMVALWLVLPRVFGPLDGADVRLEGVRYWFLVTRREYATWNVNLAHIAPFPFAPALLAVLVRPRTALRVAAVSVFLFVLLSISMPAIPHPLPDWQTWSLQDIGARAMISGTIVPSSWSIHLAPFAKSAGIVVLAALLVGSVEAWRRRPREGRILLALAIVNLAMMNILWFYNDRYYLAFIPTFAYVAASAFPDRRAAVAVSCLLLTLWSFVSVTGVRDMLATNAVAARVAAELESAGVPPSQIDAGYPLNGWRLYVHPENLPPGADRRYAVPYVNSSDDTLYRVSSGPSAGYEIVREEPLPNALWQVTDRLYVLRKK